MTRARGGTSQFPLPHLEQDGGCSRGQRLSDKPQGVDGNIIKPVSKVVLFALGEERWDPGKDSSWKAKGRPSSQ